MTPQRAGRFMADLTQHDELVVFIIGFRPNRLRKARTWIRVLRAMPRMLSHLDAHPEKGLLGAWGCLSPWPTFVQYWRSFEDLEQFAHDADGPHVEPWTSYNRLSRDTGDVGIWHETYRVRRGDLETIYTNMPDIGLGKAIGSTPVTPTADSAAARMNM